LRYITFGKMKGVQGKIAALLQQVSLNVWDALAVEWERAQG